MLEHSRRNERVGPSVVPMLLVALLLVAVPNISHAQCLQTPTPTPTPTPTCVPENADAVIGWDGDHDAVYAHLDGSFHIRDGKCITVGFSVYNNATGGVSWYNESGYLPCLVTQFQVQGQYGIFQVTISNFGDNVSVGYPVAHSYVAIYSRVSIHNFARTAQSLCPMPSAQLIPLPPINNCATPIPGGGTVNYDYVIAVDRFGNTYPWPSDADLANAGSWDTHHANMVSYWNNKLAGIVNVTQLPNPYLIQAYKSGYIYTQIVKDGSRLNVSEGPLYDRVFNHDEIGILANLFVLGDFTSAQTFLPNLGHGSYAEDGQYKYPWPWALYLEKTDDVSLVSTYFNCIYTAAHQIHTDRTGPGGIIKTTFDIDNTGFWTVDNWSALMGLKAYEYICSRLGYIAETTWATNEYNSLLTSVNNTLSLTMTSSNIDYIPPAMLESNQLRDPRDAIWASMLNFGRWAWDGYLFGASQSGVSLTNIDNTYDAGFLGGHAAGLDYHNFGFFPGFSPTGYSTVYNAGSASAALRGERYRSEGIYAYEFMISNGQSGPYSWHEDYNAPGSSPWIGVHPASGYPDAPHMWGQANANKVLIDSLIGEKTGDGSVIIGRGIPNSWVTGGQVTQLSNFPIAHNNRMGFTLQGVVNNQITLTLTGASPMGGAVLDLRALQNNILAVSPPQASPNPAAGTVTLPYGTTSATVTLTNPNPTPIPTPTPRPTPAYTPPVGGTLIEAESGTLTGCYVQADPNASGGARVDGIDANGDNVAFTNFPGTSVLKIRYASPNNGTFGLYVFGVRLASIPITSTGAWTVFKEVTVNVTIPTGAPVKFQYDNNSLVHDVAINLDCIVLGVLEMESGTRTGGATVVADSYASAGLRVDNLFTSNDSVTFSSFPAASQLAFRYSTSSLHPGDTNITLYIDNVPQGVTLPDTGIKGGGGPYAYKDQVVDVNIRAGATVKIQGNTGGALYDCINLAPKLEAENAMLHSCSKVPDPNASNGYRVDIATLGASVSFPSVQGGGRIAFRYKTGASFGLMSLYISGQLRAYVFFPTASLFNDKIVATNISPGASVTLQFDNGDSPVDLDYIRVY
jgi:hypothetical protein